MAISIPSLQARRPCVLKLPAPRQPWPCVATYLHLKHYRTLQCMEMQHEMSDKLARHADEAWPLPSVSIVQCQDVALNPDKPAGCVDEAGHAKQGAKEQEALTASSAASRWRSASFLAPSAASLACTSGATSAAMKASSGSSSPTSCSPHILSDSEVLGPALGWPSGRTSR